MDFKSIVVQFLYHEYSIDEDIFHSILYDFIKLNNFKESIVLIEEYYEVEQIKEKRYKMEIQVLGFFKFNEVPCKVSESLPDKFEIPRRLYTELLN